MKKLFVIAIFCSLGLIGFGQRMKYVDKKQAKDVVKLLEDQSHVYLYCGCCTESDKRLVKVISVNDKERDKDHHVIELVYSTDDKAESQKEELDLSAVWIKAKKINKTVVEELELETYTCEYIGNVEWPKK